MEDLHEQCLKANREWMLKNVELSEDLLGYLVWIDGESGVISDEHEAVIRAKVKNETRKVAVSHFLREILPLRRSKAFHNFLKALQNSGQGHVADHLNGWLERKRAPSNEEILRDIEKGNSEMKITLQVGKPVQSTQECYTVTRKLRGLAVIINNMKFDNEESTPARKGSEYDVINMKNLFDGLHFEVREHHNKNAQEILECLKEDKRTLPDSDIFVAVIMSDGSKNCVYGTDGKRVQIEDITTIFNEKNCPKLRETPKIFFIQACQDEDARRHSGGDKSASSSMAELSQDVTDTTESDQLHQFVVAPGDLAWRNIHLGSYLIRTIVAVFNHYAHLEHFEDMILRVTAVMALWGKKRELKMSVKKVGTLTKKLYFCPKYFE